jgi:hypothetical protein
MLFDFGVEVGEVDVALGIATYGNHAKSHENGAGRVRAVCGDRNEADVAMSFTSRLVPSADGEKSGIFALGPGIGLKRDVGKTRDFA